MLVAKEKRKENIAEYILYLYQIEDLIRAFKLDMSLIENKLVSSYKADEKTSQEITQWYQNLVTIMEKEGIREKGQMQFLSNLISDVNSLHLKLLETKKFPSYIQNFQSVAGLLTELKIKNTTAKNDFDLAITSIYGFLLLKIQQKNISAETTDAIKRISQWVAALSKIYLDLEKGKLDI